VLESPYSRHFKHALQKVIGGGVLKKKRCNRFVVIRSYMHLYDHISKTFVSLFFTLLGDRPAAHRTWRTSHWRCSRSRRRMTSARELRLREEWQALSDTGTRRDAATAPPAWPSSTPHSSATSLRQRRAGGCRHPHRYPVSPRSDESGISSTLRRGYSCRGGSKSSNSPKGRLCHYVAECERLQ
jgi:hypothetical protein